MSEATNSHQLGTLVKDRYSFKLRPAHHSDARLIEFVKTGDLSIFMQELQGILEECGFVFDSLTDVWMNDEILIHLKSPNGETIITKDIWNMVFILGEENQSDIHTISQKLLESGKFERIEVDPDEYK